MTDKEFFKKHGGLQYYDKEKSFKKENSINSKSQIKIEFAENLLSNQIKKLIKLPLLEKGSETYYAAPPNLKAIEKAIIVINCLIQKGFEDIFIDTHVESGVFIEIRNGNKYLNFETYSYFEDDEYEFIVYSIGNRFENKDDYIVGEIYTDKELSQVIEKYIEEW